MKYVLLCFRINNISEVVVRMCNSLLFSAPSSFVWMGVLPLLHAINLENFVTGHPIDLPKTEESVVTPLFCGINATDNK